MTPQDRHGYEQNIRSECIHCCGSHHFGPVRRDGVSLFGQLVCARQEKEQEFLKLRQPLDDARALLKQLEDATPPPPKGGAAASTAEIEAAKATVQLAEEKFAHDVYLHKLKDYQGKPDALGDRKCPTLTAWDGAQRDTPPPADLTAQVDKFLGSCGLARLNP